MRRNSADGETAADPSAKTMEIDPNLRSVDKDLHHAERRLIVAMSYTAFEKQALRHTRKAPGYFCAASVFIW